MTRLEVSRSNSPQERDDQAVPEGVTWRRVDARAPGSAKRWDACAKCGTSAKTLGSGARHPHRSHLGPPTACPGGSVGLPILCATRYESFRVPMANNNQHTTDEEEIFRARLGSRGGTGLKVALAALSVILVLVVVAWYWPLHRAHAALRVQYVEATSQAKGLRTRLGKTIAVLETTTTQRNALQKAEAERALAEKARADAIEKLKDELEGILKPYVGREWISVNATGTRATVTLQSRVLQDDESVDLTAAGRTVLCKALEPLKAPRPIHVKVEGVGTEAAAKSRRLKEYETALEVGAARAARAAPTALKCGVPQDKLTVAGTSTTSEEEPTTLRLVFQADAAQSRAQGAQDEPEKTTE